MPLFFADLVREFSHGTGAGDLPMGGAVPGHRRFADAVPAGARFHYAIAGVTRAAQWETGEGEIGSGGTLVRAPFASSAGGALVDFSAGLKTVALTVGAAWFAAREQAAPASGVEGLEEALAEKADAAHDHDGVYAAAGHDHEGAYAPAGHGHAGIYAPAGHHHDGAYAAAGHHHDGAYAAAGHHHHGAYQPADAELSALAALDTTAFGRGLLEVGDAAGLRAAADSDARYLRTRNLGVGLIARYPVSGRYYPATGCTFGATAGGAVTSTSLLYAQAFEIRMTLTHISFEVTVAGGAAGRVRIGIYDCLDSGLPGNLLQDLGETAVDSVGIKHAALAAPFDVTRPVWFAFISNDLIWQTRWFDILASENQRAFGASALNGGGTVAGLRGVQPYGPLPASFPAIASTYGQCRTFAGRGSG